MNRLTVLGRFTADPEIRYGGNGNAYANFNLAVNRRFHKEGEPTADFLRFTAFGKTAEFIEKYCNKGTSVIVEAEVRNNNFQQDGKTVYRDQYVVNNIEFAGSRSNNTETTHSAAVPDPDEFMSIPDGLDAELPFN